MIWPIKKAEDAPPLASESLESLLQEICKFGRPNLYQFKDGAWECSVDVWVNPVGAQFKVRSEMFCKTPKDAAIQARDRVVK